jgi:multicomponent Na+:H+ antiporter subunit A
MEFEITILILFLAAGASLMLPSKLSFWKGLILSLFPFGVFVYFLFQIPVVSTQGMVEASHAWMPVIHLNLSFTLDGLSLLFALLITGIGSFIIVYAHEYMRGYAHTGRFYFYLLVFMGSMLGVVLSANLILLFIFWELTGVSSFLLIGFKHKEENVRKSALQALLVTGFGGLMMVSGFVLMGIITGTYNMQELINHSDRIVQNAYYLPILILILGGAFSKSAQFPLHFWLPGAMQAPSPVSAFLHSATMVKAGIYLLARLNPVLGNTIEWQTIIPLFGGATMLLGAFLALTQRDLKAILAYTTISALGTLMLLIGIDTKLAMKAALIFLIVHAFYKGTLFMVAGAIDKQTGTRDIDKLGNLYRKMPITTLVAVLALLSMAGLPPMLGFISKEIIYDANIQAPHISDFVIVFGVLANVFMVWVSLYFAYNVFFKRTNFSPKEPVKGAIQFWIGPGILALGGLLLGLFPYQFGKKLIQPALSVIQAEELNISLKLWHGFNDIFLLSLFTVIAGVGLFFFRKQVIPFIRWFNKLLFRIDLSAAFFGFIDWIIGFAKKETKLIQHGYHRIYLMVLFVMVGLLGWYQLINTQFWQFNSDVSDASVYVVALSVIIVIATIFTILSQSRMTAIISMGVVGYGIALLYLTFSAIDLAITQLLVETLTVVIFVLVIVKLPRFARLSTRASKIRDAVIALVVGGFMTGVALKAKDIEFKEPISGYFVENSLDKAFGSNVVNVILVDFRALDTLGEITVLMVAALGIVALLKTSNR